MQAIWKEQTHRRGIEGMHMAMGPTHWNANNVAGKNVLHGEEERMNKRKWRKGRMIK